MKFLPRIIRLRDAPDYLGMDRNRFNTEVRPSLNERRMGTQGVAFDRLELDAWADRFFGHNDQAEPFARKEIENREFEAALEKATKRKRGTPIKR